MLEIRYNIDPKILTGWCRDPKQFGNLKDRGSEVVIVLDIPIPNKPLDAWLYDGNKLIPNPDYIEPEPPRDPLIEIDELKEANIILKAEIKKLKEVN